jgi:uncharacterized membrane protein (UPF0127 family)
MRRLFCIVMMFFYLTTGVFALEVNKENYAVLGGRKIYLKIAETQKEQMEGLMYIKNLPEYQGMIFLFPQAEKRTFWMKNVNIPLDMIFLRKQKIMSIQKNVSVNSGDKNPLYRSFYKSDAVIEVNGGFCDKYGINQGDFIYLSDGVKIKWEQVKTSF